MHRPAPLLADEPTGNLDPTTAATVMDALVTHSLAATQRADRVLSLRAEGLVETPS